MNLLPIVIFAPSSTFIICGICCVAWISMNNYSQMKLDGPKNHIELFEDNGEKVKI